MPERSIEYSKPNGCDNMLPYLVARKTISRVQVLKAVVLLYTVVFTCHCLVNIRYVVPYFDKKKKSLEYLNG